MTKIMLVEDDKSLREIYSIRLVAEGYNIVSAGDGEEGLALAVQEKPDLIIADVMMPKISGFDMLDILRSTPETQNVKVIMMTALSSDDQRQRGEALGANRYLVKSQVGIEDVVNTVHELLEDAPNANAASNLDTVAAIPVRQPAPGETITPAYDQAQAAAAQAQAAAAPVAATPTYAPQAPAMSAMPAVPAMPQAPVAPAVPVAGIPQAPVATPVAPVAPVAEVPQMPVTPVEVTAPVAPVEVAAPVAVPEIPQAPVMEAPVAPAAPTVEMPAAPTVEMPAAPAVEMPAMEAPQAPIIPPEVANAQYVTDSPVAPVAEVPQMPVAPVEVTAPVETAAPVAVPEIPQAPVMEAPVTPAAPTVEMPAAPAMEAPVAPELAQMEPIAPVEAAPSVEISGASSAMPNATAPDLSTQSFSNQTSGGERVIQPLGDINDTSARDKLAAEMDAILNGGDPPVTNNPFNAPTPPQLNIPSESANEGDSTNTSEINPTNEPELSDIKIDDFAEKPADKPIVFNDQEKAAFEPIDTSAIDAFEKQQVAEASENMAYNNELLDESGTEEESNVEAIQPAFISDLTSQLSIEDDNTQSELENPIAAQMARELADDPLTLEAERMRESGEAEEIKKQQEGNILSDDEINNALPDFLKSESISNNPNIQSSADVNTEADDANGEDPASEHPGA